MTNKIRALGPEVFALSAIHFLEREFENRGFTATELGPEFDEPLSVGFVLKDEEMSKSFEWVESNCVAPAMKSAVDHLGHGGHRNIGFARHRIYNWRDGARRCCGRREKIAVKVTIGYHPRTAGIEFKFDFLTTSY